MGHLRSVGRGAPLVIAAVTFALLLLASVARGQEATGDLESLFGTSPWRLVMMTVDGEDHEVPADTGVFSLNLQGRMAGSVGCNQMVFGGELEPAGAATFGPVTATLMACPEPAMSLERAFVGALEAVEAYEAWEGAITLTGPDTRLVFEALGPPSGQASPSSPQPPDPEAPDTSK